MTFSIAVSGSLQTDDERAKRNAVNRIRTAASRLYLELQRAGVEVTSFTLGGDLGGKDAPTYAPLKARTAPAATPQAAAAGFAPREGRVETGQPGAKSALELSVDAGTTSTESQPEPAPTGPETEKTAGVEANPDALAEGEARTATRTRTASKARTTARTATSRDTARDEASDSDKDQ